MAKTVMVSLISNGEAVGTPMLMVLRRNWFKWNTWRNVDTTTFTNIPPGTYHQAIIMDEDGRSQIVKVV